MSPFLCCLGVRPGEENATSDLQTLPSALHLPASQIPHAGTHSRSGRNNTDALRELFRTSSSIRGYRTASIPSGSHLQRETSFDTDFKFGSHEQVPKQPGRLEQIGKHIKQKLSESRLSKSGSRAHLSSEDSSHDHARRDENSLGISIPEISLSQQSTGLFDLLQSRTASEGGYDSDAKSIQTAMLKSREGTMKLSSQRARTSLSHALGLPPIPTDGAPLSPDAMRPAEFIAAQADCEPSLAPKVSSDSFAIDGEQRLSSSLARPLRAGDTDGIKEGSDTCKMDAVLSFPTLEAAEPDPFTTLPLMDNSGPGKSDQKFVEMLKKTGETDSTVKRESVVSNLTDPRASLVSNLDPSLLDFISRYGEETSTRSASVPSTVPPSGQESGPKPSITRVPMTSKSSMAARENSSKKDLSSITESERNSVHLYNMRISQRLGSPSYAASSRPNISHTTAQGPKRSSIDDRLSYGRPSTAGTASGHITNEHNRRPSDPHTRRLFEGGTTISGPPPTYRPGASPIESFTHNKLRPMVNTDDTSSFYWSDGEAESSQPSGHRTSKRNPNSIAIGGRSESVSLPIGSSTAGVDVPLVAEERVWFGRKRSQQKRRSEEDSPPHQSAKRNRSVSMPTKRADDNRSRLTSKPRRSRHATETNETMSEISVEQMCEARSERMTEISAQAIRDARSERMSEIGPLDRGYLETVKARPAPAPFWSDAGPSAHIPGHSVGERRSVTENPGAAESTLSSRPKLLESTTDIWQRSFQRAFEEPPDDSLGGFLTAPKFDRNGRRRSTRSSISVVQPSHEHRRSDADVDPLDVGPHDEMCRSREKDHLDVCMKKPDPLPIVNPRRSIAIIDTKKDFLTTQGEGKPMQKKSLSGLARRLSVLGTSEAERESGTDTPLREILGLWGRFPSNTREDRCASAGARDGVSVRDFALECQNENSPAPPTTHQRSATALELHTPSSWKMLSFGKKGRQGKFKAQTASPLRMIAGTQSLGRRPKKARKGLTDRLKKLYRTSSMEFQAYTQNYGHRSSIGMGAGVEYPELEVIQGSTGWRSDLDGTTDTAHQHRSKVSDLSLRHLPSPLDSAPWTQTYRDCVGSLSALKSDPELRRMSIDDEPGRLHNRKATLGGLSSADLRDSTVNFESQLGKENEAAKEGLIRKVESMQLEQA